MALQFNVAVESDLARNSRILCSRENELRIHGGIQFSAFSCVRDALKDTLKVTESRDALDFIRENIDEDDHQANIAQRLRKFMFIWQSAYLHAQIINFLRRLLILFAFCERYMKSEAE